MPSPPVSLSRRAVAWLAVVSVLGAAVLLVGRTLPDYLVPATELGVMPLLSIAGPPEVPHSPAGRALVAHLDAIGRDTTSGRYQHRTDVEPSEGRYHWDCSGMVGWLLRRHAPRAFRALGRGRPVAADYARHIAAAPEEPGGPWRRMARIEDVRAGDVFAWRTPPELRFDGSTGHAGIVLATPRRAVSGAAIWSVLIADSTTVPHERDTRLSSGDADGGLGTGVMSFVVDESGAVTHYGWMGILSPIYVEAEVVFGRLGG